jgi:hypothetical protein
MACNPQDARAVENTALCIAGNQNPRIIMVEHGCCRVHERNRHCNLSRLAGRLKLLFHVHVKLGPFFQRKLDLQKTPKLIKHLHL